MRPPVTCCYALISGRLKESAPSRIVNVSSLAHFFTWQIDLKDLNFEKRSYGTLAAYAQSKLCNILFSLELADKLRGSGKNKWLHGRKMLKLLFCYQVSKYWVLILIIKTRKTELNITERDKTDMAK